MSDEILKRHQFPNAIVLAIETRLGLKSMYKLDFSNTKLLYSALYFKVTHYTVIADSSFSTTLLNK
jgi:hypothetical protein